MARLDKIAVSAIALFGLAGCSVALAPRIPSDLGERRVSGEVAAEPAAQGMPQNLGFGTFTAFAIPVAGVHVTNGPGSQLIMDSIKQTLRSDGYEVVDATEATHGPVLECRVTRARFRNYTWLFPIVPTWGSIDLELTLADVRGGVPTWSHAYHSSSWNLLYSFDRAVNGAMTGILERFAKDAADPSFQRACCSGVR